MSEEEIKSYGEVKPQRADILLPGAIILEQAMKMFEVKEVRHCKYAMRDGMMVRIAH